MNTAKLKRFATEARTKIKQGVIMMMRQWGFDADGNVVEEPIKIDGGTIFRGAVIGGEDVYNRWEALRKRISTVGLKQVYEEASYTWFNRFVAIKILSKNGLLEGFLDEVEGTPLILSQARRNLFPLTLTEDERRKALELAGDHEREFELFTFLITSVCHSTPILANCFGKINDYTELLLPRSILSKGDFIDMLNDEEYICDDDYCQAELIGWLYQFYIAERKDEVFASFKSGKKAAKEDIPAATQIFTPNWIVKYMVQNTVGRIYLDNFPDSELASNWKYLVAPAEGSHSEDNILKIENPEELTLGDLGCGSGHILVEGFDVLFAIYKEQYASDREACESIFKYNLVGVDIDTRAKQLAQFALLMKACKYVPDMADCHVMPHIYDMPDPLSESVMKSLRETLPHFFLGGTEKVISETIEALELLQQAQDLGSVMKFNVSDSTRYAIETALNVSDGTQYPFIEHLRLMLVLTSKFASLCMNPPYMGASNMNPELSKYVKSNYENGKQDLYSTFMYVAINKIKDNAKIGLVTMESWMFLTSFENLRKEFLEKYHIDSLSHFDWHIMHIAFGTVSYIISKYKDNGSKGVYSYLYRNEMDWGNDVPYTFPSRENGRYKEVSQNKFKKIPGCPIGYWVSEKAVEIAANSDVISKIAAPRQGLATGDNNRFLRFLWEVDKSKRGKTKWVPCTKGGTFRKWFGNIEYVVNWEDDGYDIKNFIGTNGKLASRPQNQSFYFKQIGCTWSTISSGKPAFRYFDQDWLFETKGSVCFPVDVCENNKLMAYLNSPLVNYYLKVYSPTMDYHEGPVGKLPYFKISDKIKECDINSKVETNISISRLDWDSHETSWDFKLNELLRISEGLTYDQDGSLLKTDVGLNLSLKEVLSKYKTDWTDRFMQLHTNEEELNRQFIDIYGLQDELTPDVPLDEITILQQGEISIEDNNIVWHDDVLMKQLISYAIGCFMGRYRLDKEGLHIAHPAPTEEELASYQYNGETFTIDDDGILPLLPEDSPFNDNVRQRMVEFISQVFGADTQVENLNFIENALGKSLGDYLMKDFWKDHKKMYQNRPIYWLFTSKKGAFQCIAYMHRMDEYTLERIRQKYLLPYISHLEAKAQALQTKDSISTAESRQLTKLLSTIEECREYHDRLHQYSQQNISFDLDDGVVKNYALFGDVVAKLK